jgi:predicted Zn-dependent peptidase
LSVRVTRLSNGAHAVTHDMPHLESVALGTWIRSGARDEAPAQGGVAHFLEHMAFKGTTKRSAMDIAAEIEAAGGDINASTGMENTGYYARVLKDDWAMALDILADIVTDPVFDPDELARERDVILQEIAAANDTPDDLVFDLAHQAAFPDHALGRPILGTAELVGSHGPEAIRDYRHVNYTANRMVIAAAGRIDHDRFAAEAEKLFSDVPDGASPDWQRPQFAGGCLTAVRPLDQAHVVLAFPGPGYRDPDVYTLQILAGLLGGGMSSRLFQEVREKRGLCYSVFAYSSSYQDSGMLTVYAATAPEHTADLVDVSTDILLAVTSKVTEAEMQRAKAQLKAGLVMNLESVSSRADQIARQYMAFGKVPELSDIMARIEAVSAQDVSLLAQNLFCGVRPAMSAVGDLNGLAPYETIAAKFA